MTPEAKKIYDDSIQSSQALINWFKSQDLNTRQAIGCMVMAIAAIVTESSKGSIIRAVGQCSVLEKALHGMILYMMSQDRDQ